MYMGCTKTFYIFLYNYPFYFLTFYLIQRWPLDFEIVFNSSVYIYYLILELTSNGYYTDSAFQIENLLDTSNYKIIMARPIYYYYHTRITYFPVID